jgi:hypothetical protein
MFSRALHLEHSPHSQVIFGPRRFGPVSTGNGSGTGDPSSLNGSSSQAGSTRSVLDVRKPAGSLHDVSLRHQKLDAPVPVVNRRRAGSQGRIAKQRAQCSRAVVQVL